MIEKLASKYRCLGWNPKPIYEDRHTPTTVTNRLLESRHRSTAMEHVRHLYEFPGLEPTVGWRAVPLIETGRDLNCPDTMLGALALSAENYALMRRGAIADGMPMEGPGQSSGSVVGKWDRLPYEDEHRDWVSIVDGLPGRRSHNYTEFFSVVESNVVLAYAPDDGKDLYFTHIPPALPQAG
jgi:hypothetical protein